MHVRDARTRVRGDGLRIVVALEIRAGLGDIGGPGSSARHPHGGPCPVNEGKRKEAGTTEEKKG